MFITTKAQYEWDKDKKEYVEVYTEGYEYEGEVALAHTNTRTHSHPRGLGTEEDAKYDQFTGLPYWYDSSQEGHQGGGIGSREWNPNEETLMGASGEDIATGFGLEAGEYGMYFQDFDPWQTELEGQQRGITETSLHAKYGEDGYERQKMEDVYASNLVNIQRQGAEAGTELSAAMGTAAGSMQSNWLDTSTQLSARTAQAGFTGAGRGRKGRQVQQDLSRSFTEMTSGSERAYDALIGDLDQQKTDLGIQKDYDESKMADIYSTGMDQASFDYLAAATEEQKSYIDDIYSMLGQLASSGAWD